MPFGEMLKLHVIQRFFGSTNTIEIGSTRYYPRPVSLLVLGSISFEPKQVSRGDLSEELHLTPRKLLTVVDL